MGWLTAYYRTCLGDKHMIKNVRHVHKLCDVNLKSTTVTSRDRPCSYEGLLHICHCLDG